MAKASCASPEPLVQSNAVDARYGVAALDREACLSTPVSFDHVLL